MPFCEGDDAVTFTEDGVFTYVTGWDPATPGTFDIVYTETTTFGCVASCSFTITVDKLPVITIEPVDDLCMDEGDTKSVTLKASVTAGEGSWSVKKGAPGPVVFSDENLLETIATVSFCGTYTFVFTAENGQCDASEEIAVTFYSVPVVVVTGDEAVCGRTANLILTVTAPCFEPVDGEWSWEPAAITVVTFEEGSVGWDVTVPECGVYTFTYTANNNGNPIR